MLSEIFGIILIFLFILFFINEQKLVIKYQSSIPIRIHVNGIRGKTSTTRMIGTVLRQYYTTTTKTTGSMPVIINPDGTEHKIKRNGIVTIKEQIDVLKQAFNNKSKAIVFECMALQPELQKTLEEKIMKSTIGIITNIRYDHEDVMGDSLEEIALSLSNTVPYNSILIVPEDIECLDIIQRIANERNTKLICSSINDVPVGYVDKFSYMNYEDNIAIVLKLADILNIPKNKALELMLNTNHDIGKGIICNKIVDTKEIKFINSFANNDPQSIAIMLSKINFKEGSNKIALLSHREDRIRRTLASIHFLCTFGFDSIMISSNNKLIETELNNYGYTGTIITTDSNFIHQLENISTNKPNYWIGIANIKTSFAETILNYFGVS